ncbi:MAG: cytochrome d ubiquinol oxidase subunit II, partial [Herbiconiux sp.]|nr:cytochrome d ubiquinol oxidase subunit II [Herbiconiux sp.]
TDGDIRGRARRLATRSGVLTVVVAAVFLVWTSIAHGTLASVLLSMAAAVALVGAVLANTRGRERSAFGLMAATIGLAVLSLFLALFPDVMPASNDVANSLTITNASSSAYTLTIMSWVALIFLPLILLYQGFTYWIFRKRVSRASIPVEAAEGAH